MARDIQFANERSQEYANKKRRMERTLKRGDKVYLLRKHIKAQRPCSKLDFKKLGPYEIEEVVSTVNYKQRLPKGCKQHPIFDISLLEPARGNIPTETDTTVDPENDPDVYGVERILDYGLVNGQWCYMIK